MVDFKKITQNIQEKNGYCYLQSKHYATISAKRTNCTTGETVDTQQPYLIEPRGDEGRLVFQLLEGPTGYESWYIESLLKDPYEGWWAACAGTKGRWDKLMVNGREVLNILKGLN